MFGDKKDNLPNGLVAVAIENNKKNSQFALKWAADHILQAGQIVHLLHVNVKHTSSAKMNLLSDMGEKTLICKDPDSETREIFLPFRSFCTRKDIECKDVVLEDTDVVKALTDYVSQAAVEFLVVGASSAKGGFLRKFKATDISSRLVRGTPDFCTVYVISKGKISTMRSASRPLPSLSTLRSQVHHQSVSKPPQPHAPFVPPPPCTLKVDKAQSAELQSKSAEDLDIFRSPFNRKGFNGKPYSGVSTPDLESRSYVSSGRASIDRIFPSLYDNQELNHTIPRVSNVSDVDIKNSVESMHFARLSADMNSLPDFSSFSEDSVKMSASSNAVEDVEAEMRRLKLELTQTMELYSTACKEALSAKQKAKELQRWKMEEEMRLEEARLAEEAALAIVEKEKAKSRAAIEAAEASQRIAEIESQKRIEAEMKALRESEEKMKALNALAQSDNRYRRYSIEEIESATEYFAKKYKVGEGGYGPVYKAYLDHTPVAIKVLRPDADQGRSQFQKEVEVLSCIRHPNMVLLLGACPEYGCLVYEFMDNGSLDDCLFHRANNPPLSWQIRFRIAAEIGTALLFLHQSKPEPLVHRDLKPGNILLDRNYTSKISDVGLARLVPPSVADNVTQYCMTSAAGTFCYIDPEYQQTGMLGIKSDVYSLGIMFLQIVTAKPPMGLTYGVENAIEMGTFADMLDPDVLDWPVQEALCFAKLALQCAELRRKDRPDLGKVVLPELNRLRAFAEETMQRIVPKGSPGPSPDHS